MSLLLLFQGGGGGGGGNTYSIAAAAGSYLVTGNNSVSLFHQTIGTSTGGGWLTAEQAAQQLREIRRQERQEEERRAKIRAKARELEETITEAYAKATGKPRLRKALEAVERPKEFTPESMAIIGRDIANALSVALEGTGRRFSQDRMRLEQLQRELMDYEVLLNDRRQRELDEIAAILLLGAL